MDEAADADSERLKADNQEYRLYGEDRGAGRVHAPCDDDQRQSDADHRELLSIARRTVQAHEDANHAEHTAYPIDYSFQSELAERAVENLTECIQCVTFFLSRLRLSCGAERNRPNMSSLLQHHYQLLLNVQVSQNIRENME